MNILIATNAFKGSLSAETAAIYIAEGIRKSKLKCTLTLFPIADGGDDTAALLNKKWNARKISTQVHDPLGRLIDTSFGWIQREKKAIIAMSDASGLKLLKKGELDPLHAHTLGTGELIKAALKKGAEKMIIGLGGSATVDGGSGLLKALGLRYYDKQGTEINDLPSGLIKLDKIDLKNLDKRSLSTKIIVLCDVQNKLLGDEGAARIFGPQKGANQQEVEMLEQILHQWNTKTIETMHIDMQEMQYGGAAGGVAACLVAYAGAKLVKGIDFFLDELLFDNLLTQADVVITGEGRIDAQTLEGKGPLGVAQRARQKGIPVIAMGGEIKSSHSKILSLYFDQLIAINQEDDPLEISIKNTKANLTRAAFNLGNNFPY
ncbi:MAG: glycerate kinase [Chitinophagaceae bacterium]|nr:MAG: glycerate kinase [Chitinophagaceae bacterium]